MIIIKNKASIRKMEEAGRLLAHIFMSLPPLIKPGVTTQDLDAHIAHALQERDMKSQSKGYKGYKHVSCISINDEVVHGVPRATTVLKSGDVVKVDVCAAYKGYCADMARVFFVGPVDEKVKNMVDVTQKALDKGIQKAYAGNRLSDISAAIQEEIEAHGYGVVRDFAGHGIGKNMHEEPEVLNYGVPGKGPILRAGMAFALEPMVTMGHYGVYITQDGWTVKTEDKSMAAHVEDTIVITDQEPLIITRVQHAKVDVV